VNVLRAPEGFLIALTYGRESEWVKNILTAGGWQLETRHVRYQLSAPAIVHDPSRRRFPLLVRMIRGLIGAKFNERSLRRILRSYSDYYHRSRTHLSLGNASPEPRSIQLPEAGRVVALPRVGGCIIATNDGPPETLPP
jgi:hypothetical protein